MDVGLLAQAEGLLALQDPDLTACTSDAVAQLVLRYREAIEQVSSRLTSLGAAACQASHAPHRASSVQPSLGVANEGPDTAGEQVEPGEGVTDQQQHLNDDIGLGEEGIDYCFGSVDDLDPSEWQVPPHCIPIHANVVTFHWPSLYKAQQFDVVMMDPPWQLATANPTRGVSLGYSQLCDQDIANIPVAMLQQQGGYLLIWVINAKYKWTLDQMERWGYRVVDEIVWVKHTVNRRLAKSHGYYLQHAKEVCLVGRRGTGPPLCAGTGILASDVIYSARRGNSQKPSEVYELVEQLVPQGRYLEIFARKNNLRDFWVSLGNEVTGTGLPQADLDAIKQSMNFPGAVYGRAGGKS